MAAIRLELYGSGGAFLETLHQGHKFKGGARVLQRSLNGKVDFYDSLASSYGPLNAGPHDGMEMAVNVVNAVETCWFLSEGRT